MRLRPQQRETVLRWIALEVTAPNSAPDKRLAFEHLLSQGSVAVHLDARHPAATVPAQFSSTDHLVLQYSLATDWPVPIRDLSVDEEGIGATLSFNRVPFKTWVPWSAVYAISNEDGMGKMWTEEAPEGLRKLLNDDQAAATRAPPGAKRALRSMPQAKDDEVPAESPPAARPNLRLVK